MKWLRTITSGFPGIVKAIYFVVLPMVLTSALFLGGCRSAQPVPVINKSPDRIIPDAYRVKSGDSIYNISWAFGVDHLDIAEWSEIKAPYKLSPGQVIYLSKPGVKTTGLGVDSSSSASASSAQAANQPLIATSLPETPGAPTPVAQTSTAAKVSFAKNPGKWNWPAEGKLVGKFSPGEGSNGIQISGASGSAVKATASGEVVYVGEGLRGYGKLIILKHSEQYLSAYAHNQDLMVKEGEVINSAQQIATMGNSGTQSTMLHFEIRKDGKPVDPLKFLK
jgi:lipoprotein NlpD